MSAKMDEEGMPAQMETPAYKMTSVDLSAATTHEDNLNPFRTPRAAVCESVMCSTPMNQTRHDKILSYNRRDGPLGYTECSGTVEMCSEAPLATPARSMISSTQMEQPKSSDKVMVVRRRNSGNFIALLVITLLIGILGGVATSIIGYRYFISDQHSLLVSKNDVALNSSGSAFLSLKNDLQRDSLMLARLVKMIGSDFDNLSEMASAYNSSFFELSSLTISLTPHLGAYTIYVPLCKAFDGNVGTCETFMLLSYMCDAIRSRSAKCNYFVSRENGIDAFEVVHDSDGNPVDLLWTNFSLSRLRSVDLQFFNETYHGHYVESSTTIMNLDMYEGVTYRQTFLLNGRVIVTEATSFFNSWSKLFRPSPLREELSFSFAFDSLGNLLSHHCGAAVNAAGVFSGSEMQSLPWNDDERCRNAVSKFFNSVFFSMGVHIRQKLGELFDSAQSRGKTLFFMENPNMAVSVQSFLHLERSDDDDDRVLFVAQATPSSTGLESKSVLQIIACVIIVATCICILGGVSLLSINELQRTLELVSILTVHITAYDWEGMEKVLDRSRRRRMRLSGILVADLLLDEFTKILKNLKTYRPFLPQAFLTDLSHSMWNVSIHGAGSERPQSRCSEDSDCQMRSTLRTSVSRRVDCRTMELALMKNVELGDGEMMVVKKEEIEADVESMVMMVEGEMKEEETEETEDGGQKGFEIGERPASSLRRVKGTVVVVQLHGCLFEYSKPLTTIDRFLAFVLKYAHSNGGVADEIATDHVIVTFNFHIPVLRHQQKACQCAMAIREECRKSNLKVSIAITSGVNYIGTVGTEEQRAHVVVGGGVDLAKRMVTLHRYLGLAILVTQEVAHESGAATVPVDKIEVRLSFQNIVTQHVILEVVALNHDGLSYDYTIAKGLFNLILTRQGGEALKKVSHFMQSFSSVDEAPWFARRMYRLCTRNMKLVDSGYCRKELLWDPVEGEEDLMEFYMPREDASKNVGLRYTDDAPSTKLMLCIANFSEIPSGMDGLVGHHPDDAERAKRKIDAQSHGSHHGVQMKERVQGEDALISLFVNDEKNSPYDEGISNKGGLIVRDIISSRPPLPRRIEDIKQELFYRTDELLGRGQFGEVYLAISANGGFVAAKVFPLEENGTALVREVETLIQLRHDHILTYDTCAIQDGYFFIFTEYMASVDMRRLINQLGRIPEKAARKYGRDVLFGLKFLHTMNYVHCDIKPDNVLLSSEGRCKLGDFGAVQLSRGLGDRGASMRGTPRYMAPEAVMGNWTVKADIYSFGLTMAHMLLGYNPWRRYVEPDEHFLLRLARDANDMRPELPTDLEDKELERIVRSCCELDPELRPTVEELLALLS